MLFYLVGDFMALHQTVVIHDTQTINFQEDNKEENS